MIEPYAIGIDIGGTNTAFGIVDRTGKIVQHGVISTKDHPKIDDYIDNLHRALTPLMKKIEGEVIGIGVGAPNGNYYNGTIEFAPNLPWKGVIHLANLLEGKFTIPVRVTNDANAAAEGEMTFGAAKGLKNFIMITLGTGLGSGVVVDGHLVYGHDGFAGELGHVIVERDGRLCGCGRKGCLETYVSATGIVRTMRERLQTTPTPSRFREMETTEITSKAITKAAAEGDELAKEVVDYTAKILGQALANFVTFSAPRAFVLFGGLARAKDLIIEPTRRYMNENMLNIWKDKIDIIHSKLPEDEAAILGASALVWEVLEDEV